jgi:hypothetical protein
MHTKRTFLLFVGFSLLAFAQSGGGRGQGRSVPRYDPSTEATFKGTVEGVEEVANPGYRGKGLHAMLKTDQGVLDVHIGPASFVAKQQLTIVKGDELAVVGSKVKNGGSDAIIARTIKKGDKTTALRTPKGMPLWSAGRRKNL